jgi:hypothetical protein
MNINATTPENSLSGSVNDRFTMILTFIFAARFLCVKCVMAVIHT